MRRKGIVYVVLLAVAILLLVFGVQRSDDKHYEGWAGMPIESLSIMLDRHGNTIINSDFIIVQVSQREHVGEYARFTFNFWSDEEIPELMFHGGTFTDMLIRSYLFIGAGGILLLVGGIGLAYAHRQET